MTIMEIMVSFRANGYIVVVVFVKHYRHYRCCGTLLEVDNADAYLFTDSAISRDGTDWRGMGHAGKLPRST